jgi:hypothetical protein
MAVEDGLEELGQEMVVSYFKISPAFPWNDGGKLRKVRVGSRIKSTVYYFITMLFKILWIYLSKITDWLIWVCIITYDFISEYILLSVSRENKSVYYLKG